MSGSMFAQVQKQTNSYTAAVEKVETARAAGGMLGASMRGDPQALGHDMAKAAFLIAGGGILINDVRQELGKAVAGVIMEALG